MRCFCQVVFVLVVIALGAGAGEAQSLEPVTRHTGLGPAIAPLQRSADEFAAAAALARASSGGRDSLWNGILMGAAAGAGYGLVIAPPQFCGRSDSECDAIVRVVIGLPSIAGGAAIGALVDYLVHQDDSPSVKHGWRRVEVAPISGRGVRGVQGRMRF